MYVCVDKDRIGYPFPLLVDVNAVETGVPPV